jgi:predicted dinucleotide-binding enzyme
MMTIRNIFVLAILCTFPALASSTEAKPVVAIIGTGDMGDSLGPRFAELGYEVIYGSRNPDGEKAQRVVRQTGGNSRATTQKDAAQAGDIVILAVGWPAMETVAQNLGPLDDKIVIDDPGVVGGPVTIPMTADDREAKEQIAKIIVEMGLDPVDAGPLRYSRELEAMQRLYGVPFFQRREAAWEFYFRRSYYWECIWQDDWSDPVVDADDLAEVPETQGEARECPGTR